MGKHERTDPKNCDQKHGPRDGKHVGGKNTPLKGGGHSNREHPPASGEQRGGR